MNIFDMLKIAFIGMAIAAPVGPISLLCIRTTLAGGFIAGFSAGLGAALADGLVCLAALMGVDLIRASPLFSGPILSHGAAAFLIYLGSRMLWRSASGIPTEQKANSCAGMSFASTFLVTVVNPLTLLSFAALFCSSRTVVSSWCTSLVTAICIFLGSAVWWLILAGFLSIARRSIGHTAMKAINIGSALCLLACGLKLFFA